MMGKQNCFKRSTAPAVSDLTYGTGCVAGGSGELGRLCGKTIDTSKRDSCMCCLCPVFCVRGLWP